MPGAVYREGETIELRTIEREDADFLQTLINDSRVRHGLGAVDPVSGVEETEWIESQGETDGITLLICAEGEPVGTIGLRPLHETWGTAELHYMIAPAAWGNGYATEACEQVCAHAFEHRRLAKVVGRAYVTNEPSCRVLEKVGFREEGLLCDEAFVDGERVDVKRYGLTADQWEESPRGQSPSI